MDTKLINVIVEQFCRNRATEYQGITVTQIAGQKTIFIEPSNDGGRSVVLSEYKVDGATYWAGFSARSQTVYISAAA